MKLQTVFLLTLLFLVKSDDSENLQYIYDELSAVYGQYSNKTFFLTPDQWAEWTLPKDPGKRESPKSGYDFIVVGSGSSGAVIANRLSENPNWEVLLLEAGKGENFFSQIPLVCPTLAFTHYNWDFIAEYQPNVSFGFENNRMRWPRGRALGGTSVINFMIYTRGNRHDYDRWAGQGNPGWSYRDVLPYFIKSERSTLNNPHPGVHGTNGYLGVSDIYQSEILRAFIEGGNELGLPYFDYNANEKSFGVSPIQATVKRGRRHTTARAFLHPIRHRKNLHMLTSAFVTKVLIDPNTRQTYGVEFSRFGRKYQVTASKEVILSAGTFNSPKLLMLAGIGPRDHLAEMGIPLLEDLPVGQNLHDHLTYPGLSFIIDKPLSLSVLHLINPKNIIDFLFNGTGPYTSLGGVGGIGYIKTKESLEVEDIPDIELLFLDGSLSTDYGLWNRRWMNIRDDVYYPVYGPTHNIPTWTIFPMLLHPKSTGYLKLKSRNPRDYPLLYGNYFTDPAQQDLKTMLAAIRYIQKLANTRPFQEMGTRMNPNPIPVCAHLIFDSDAYWMCAIRAISVTLHHQVGTAKMGPKDDPTAVVNHELKVYGVKGLRVADCSVIPFALGAHTNAPAIMVGEKAADLIKADWEKVAR
ncbi:glucose dehydrogenase [FAD, quinone] [Tribolium castaneum]|nr:PREDICTED: glucose dehydrogenase [FAD, quinone] [Tribolium castaneum]XP_015836549.1 PREDICTED: glucose dehydrogenase [FAD, quinone] [Tribolium castaneum]|eukprot:XP_008191961.1 PREDICTED: glucose dehydrogenase [FAD, quinone] [Tribolium castaneum]